MERRRAIWSQALEQTVADATHWSSAPWDTMTARGSACAGMIYWIRLWLQEWAVSNVKCNHIALICFPTVLFLSNSVLASGVRLMCYVVPWGATPSCSDHHSAHCSPECAAESPVKNGGDVGSGVKPVHSCHSSPSHPIMHPKNIGSDVSWGDDANIYIYLFSFQSSLKPSAFAGVNLSSGLLKKRKEQVS